MKFSPDGVKLLSIGDDNDHSVAVYDWEKRRMLCNAKCDPAKMFTAVWSTNTEFVCVGQKVLKFFTQKGSNLTPKKGLFGGIKQVPVLSCAYAWGDLYTGTSKGHLIKWSGRKAAKEYTVARKEQIWGLHFNGQLLIAGAMNGVILFYKDNMTIDRKIELAKHTSCPPGVRALDWQPDMHKLLVGTRGAEIFEISMDDDVRCYMHGHYGGELWGAAPHPERQMFASAGGDKTV